ncbi:hypothetical protein NL676_035930 [Syzygium grande]|nr:hypothetical protein NL676_035930 [Syzygium grande]
MAESFRSVCVVVFDHLHYYFETRQLSIVLDDRDVVVLMLTSSRWSRSTVTAVEGQRRSHASSAALAWVASNVEGPDLSRPVVAQPRRCLAWRHASSAGPRLGRLDRRRARSESPGGHTTSALTRLASRIIRGPCLARFDRRRARSTLPRSRSTSALPRPGVAHPPWPWPRWSRDLDSVLSGVARSISSTT